MSRAPSQRELVATLVACAESESEEGEEIERLLDRHAAVLTDVLGIARSDLLAVSALDSTRRSAGVRSLVRQAKERQQAVHARAMEGLSIAAASMLANLAKWHDDRVELATRIVLGRGICANRTRKYVAFDAEGYASVAVRRTKLQEASRALQFPDVVCHLDARGLCFTWRAGKGGLILTAQQIEPKDRDAVLPIIIVRPVARSPQRGLAMPAPNRPNWFQDAFAQLTPL